MKVPFLDLITPHREICDELLPLWEEILLKANFIGGVHVVGLEKEFSEACGTQYAVAVGSGTDALRFVFLALDLKPGDEVITTPNTFIATSESITQAGGKVVFVDVDPDTYTLDPSQLEAAITPRTKGVVPVHLYGQMADMDAILDIAKKHGLWVVEDAAQAHLAEYKGGKAGSIGIAGTFSFYPGKNMGACGEAGAITTNDADLARKVAMIRDHGQAKKYYHDTEGYNGRCDAIQAAVLRVKLKRLPEQNEMRRRKADMYHEHLDGIEGIKLPGVSPHCLPVWHLYVVEVDNRDDVVARLNEKGIGTGVHYPVPLHRQKAYAYLGIGAGSYPVTTAAAERVLSLPMFPHITEEHVAYVCGTLKEIVSTMRHR